MRRPHSTLFMINSFTMKHLQSFSALPAFVAGFILSGFFSLPANAGLVVTGTRFVLPAPQTALGITVQNTGPSSLLVKSQVQLDRSQPQMNKAGSRTVDAESDASFVLTPPLFVLRAEKSNQLRLTCLECAKLPPDRESLFRLSISAIPSGKAPENSVQLAIRSHFKLFYRPEGLSGSADTAYQRLQWQRRGKMVTVSNPSPYYVTLFKMTVNHRPLNNPGMVPPFSTVSQPWCVDSGSCTIEWQTLDDFGGEKTPWIVVPTAQKRPGRAG
ncbi:fimbrial biogenesis chaperone [Klebsiella aerogenes]|uniref:fimbrial biogenesis chaperone n=1 Tax=Klebsiella aerogenes TaxID=548 RepID=UPI0021D23B3C|nr:molecular chaperone [Klebsiella aerogenes]MCU6317026.1 molecular chaperone [Klebsiella aerogenes]